MIFGLISILFEFIYISKLEDKFVGLFIVSVIITVLGAFFVYQKKQIYNWVDKIFPKYYGIVFYALCLMIIFLIPIIAFTILKCSICVVFGFVIEIFIVAIVYILMRENTNANNMNQNEDHEYVTFGNIETVHEENNFTIDEEEKGELEQELKELEQEEKQEEKHD